jgi:hypothetical protein
MTRKYCPRFTIRHALLLTAVLAVFIAINASSRRGVVSTMIGSSHGTFYEIGIEGNLYGWPLPFYATKDDSEMDDYSSLHLIGNIAVATAAGLLSVVTLRILGRLRALRTASILLALVLAVPWEANAELGPYGLTSHSIEFGRHEIISISDWEESFYWPAGVVVTGPRERYWTTMRVGSLGPFEVPFTATQGLIAFYLLLATSILVPVALSIRWKKKWNFP